MKADAAYHAEQGLNLRDIWSSADDSDEIIFIFAAADLDHARWFIEPTHEQKRREEPDANLPQLLFLTRE